MDVWGLYNTPNHNGARYFLTIVNEFSRGTWAFLLQSKNETFAIIKKFLALVKTQYASYVKKIRSNNVLDSSNLRATRSLYLKVLYMTVLVSIRQNKMVL